MNSGLFAGPARPTTPINIIPSPLGQVAGCGPLVAQVFELSPFLIGNSVGTPNFQAAVFGDWSPPRGVSRAWVSAVASGGFSSGDGGSSSGLGGGGASCVRLPIPCIPGIVVRYYVGPTGTSASHSAALMYYRINPDGSLGFGPAFGSPNPINALQVRCDPGSLGTASSGTVATGGNGGGCVAYSNNTSIATAIAAAGAALPATSGANMGSNSLRAFFPYQDFLPYSALYSGAGGAAYGSTGPVALACGGLSVNTNMSSHVSFRANQYLTNPTGISPAPSALSFLASNAKITTGVEIPVPGTWGNGAPYNVSSSSSTVSNLGLCPGPGAVIFEWEER